MQAGPAQGVVSRLDAVELQLQVARDVAGLGMWEWDPATGRLDVDARCERLLGMEPGTFDGQLETYAARLHPADRAVVKGSLVAAVRDGGTVEVQPRVLWPDGTVRHLMVRGRALPGPDGGVAAVVGAVLDVTDLHRAVEARSRAAHELAGLAGVALELARASSLDDLQRTVIHLGLSVLGADGGAVFVRDEVAGVVRPAASASLPGPVRSQDEELPLDGPLPGSRAARTGETFFLPDSAAGLAVTSLMQGVYDRTGRQAWAALPLRARDQLLGSLVVSWTEPRSFPQSERELLHAFAAQCAQALDRIQTLAAERAAALAASRLSETLQRSLLTDPPQPDHLHIEVRYRPAGRQAQVGGDWYDAFLTPDGATCLVIGDVTGHDRDAAAQMGALRNLLRATAYALDASPAQVLGGLERSMAGLGVDALATGILARIEQSPRDLARGVRVLRWANAGHLPPLLLQADGTVAVLDTTPDLLLGLVPEVARRDHVREIEPGATLLLYTDGLVERRGEDLDDGIGRLRHCLQELALRHADDLGALCDGVLAALLPDTADDDVALVAVRLHPQDGLRPATAPPARLPVPLQR